MAKKSPKRPKVGVPALTAQVKKLRAQLEKAEARTSKWRAEAKQLEAEAVRQAKKLKKLRKVQGKPVAAPPPPPAAAVGPDESWTVTRLRAAARDAGVTGYSKMTKAALLDSLSRGASATGR
ncbi:MAG TPA: hypothetical protein VLI04_14520 [Nocardioidaceae bacterium]|nr:hypothetical protein [Nocardioidaceae bacterium]